MENPINVITPNKSTVKYGWHLFLWFLLFGLLLFAIYWVFIKVKVNRAQVKLLIASEAAKYGAKAADVEKLLLQGVDEIQVNPMLMRQLATYAKNSGLPVEQILVADAVAMARQNKYIQ